MLFKKIFMFLMLIGVFFGSSISVIASSNDELLDYEEVLQVLSKPDDYVEWLESLDDEGASEVINDFLDLTEEEQELFMNILQPYNYVEVLNLIQHEPGNFGILELDDFEVPFSVVSDETPKVYSMTPIIIEETEQIYEQSSIGRSTRELNFTRSYSIKIVGVSITRFESQMYFRVNSNNNPTSTTHQRGAHTNWNPGLWVTNEYSHHRMSNGMATGYTQFRVNMTATLGGISFNVRVETRRNGTRNQGRMWSSNSNWNTSWS